MSFAACSERLAVNQVSLGLAVIGGRGVRRFSEVGLQDLFRRRFWQGIEQLDIAWQHEGREARRQKLDDFLGRDRVPYLDRDAGLEFDRGMIARRLDGGRFIVCRTRIKLPLELEA